ncbi:MAG: winged helix-turn-helix domain-containing protein [Bacteroidales bacterium]|nr:winged helix-turn-helix domain-containing protein [Bacteroidales bacterium]
MEINNIGNNAGILWNALNSNGKMTETKLKKESGLASAEFYTALGWLAREGKVSTVVETRCGKDCEYYTLNA